MEHDIAQLRLSELLEDTLSPVDRQALEAHLQTCAECQDNLELLRRTLAAVRSLPKIQAPPHFATRLRRRVAQSGLGGGRRRRRPTDTGLPFSSTVVMAVLLAAVGALLILVLVFQQKLELLVDQPPPVVIHLTQPSELAGLAGAAWQVGGSVRTDGRLVPPASTLFGAALEVDLELPADRWGDFTRAAREAGVDLRLPATAPGVTADGRAHLLVAP